MNQAPAEACAPSASFRLFWALRDIPRRLRSWIADLLLQGLVRLSADSNLMRHARRELPPESGDDMQRTMNRDLLHLLAVFASQGHSGFSASYATSVLEKLMRFEPLGPLTGADDEWFDHGNGMFQNIRCSHVFKDPERFNGQPYDIYARVFREPNGCCYTNGDSHQPIAFPYTPKREYVDVPESTS